jgi:anti-sigma B factor antagonist
MEGCMPSQLIDRGHDLKTLFTPGPGSPTEGLESTVTQTDEGAIVRLNGRVNIESSPLLRDRLLCLLRDSSVKSVIIDLAKVSYVDSSGVATLIESLKVARHRRVALQLQGLEGRLLHLFEVTGVLALFEMNGAANPPSISEVS